MKIISVRRRSGLTLLEVLVSLAVFLTFLTAITQLLNICTSLALEVQNVNQASQLLQSQMNRVLCGEIPLSSQGETSVDGDADWTWSMQCDAEGTPNLWNVTITVNHTSALAGEEGSWSLHQLVLDPTARGSIQASSSSSSSSPPSNSSNMTGGGP
jgi:general secretion pathway protein I